MPKRAPIGNRERIEAGLTPAGRQHLRETCADAAIPPHDWQAVDALNRHFTLSAIMRRARNLQTKGALSEAEAITRSAEYFGWDGASVGRLLSRRGNEWTRHYVLRQSAPTR